MYVVFGLRAADCWSRLDGPNSIAVGGFWAWFLRVQFATPWWLRQYQDVGLAVEAVLLWLEEVVLGLPAPRICLMV
jgi:hypothetical protein